MTKFPEDLVPFNRLVDDYKKSEEEKGFMQAVVDGLLNIEREPAYTLEEAKKRLGLKSGISHHEKT